MKMGFRKSGSSHCGSVCEKYDNSNDYDGDVMGY
jgi:hypothetical protein